MTTQREHHKLDTDTHVYFYEAEFYVLSNFSAFRLYWKANSFDTAEHAYHWEKFHHAPDVQMLVHCARSAHDAFKVAEANRDKLLADWPDRRVDVMRGILWAKVKQHEYVFRKLLETGDRELVEDSWRDAWWGWGADRQGQNMLGKLWMEIRAELRKQGNQHEPQDLSTS